MIRNPIATPMLAPLLLLLLQALPGTAAERRLPMQADGPLLLADLGTLMRPQQRRDRPPEAQRLALAAPAPVAALPVTAVAAALPAAAPAPFLPAPMLPAPAAVAPAALPPTAAPLQVAQAAQVAQVATTPARGGTPDARFDLAINNAPAAQVFLQLAQGTGWNMLVAPEVSGTLSIALKDTTVPEAMDTLRELFGYEYRITGNRIFVYPNTVQTRLYRVNYLPGRRQGASDIRVSSSAMTSGATTANGASGNTNQGGGGSPVGNRPDDNAHVRTTSDADFWREVQASLAALVGSAGGRQVVLNPAAGVVVVKATPGELRQVEQYLKAVQLSIERQVMLEAKIVEVSLSKDAQTGINWGAFGKLGSGQLSIGSAAPGSRLGTTGPLGSNEGTLVAPGVDMATGALGRGFYGLAFQATNFAALLNFLESQGDVHVLSSPRIATLNNQKALLKVGSDELYVTGISTSNSTTNNSSGSTNNSSPTLQLTPFFSGIVLDVTPQIDANGQVMLHVHPSISLVTEREKILNLGTLGNFRLPLASSAINETDSIVRVGDGQIVAIGGLMTQELRGDRTGLPVLSNLPLVGNLFGQKQRVNRKRELVILIKPTVIPADGRWPAELAAPNLPVPPEPVRKPQ